MSAIMIMLAGLGASEQPIEAIEVKGQTPLHSENGEYLLGTMQKANSLALEKSQSISITDFLKNNLRNVHVNDAQNNPFQPDVQYRGFTASPLLGLPQGISVYLNGFRFNEPFGDTVNWDLVSLSAIDEVTLFSGSNPLFGYNTLGGALALSVKNGFEHDVNQVTLSAGNHGANLVNLQSGGHNEHWAYYFNVNQYEEDGWRDASPTDVKQYLANVSYKNDKVDASLLLANNYNIMVGNGAVPLELLELQSPRAIYTQPDQTNTAMKLLGLSVDVNVSDTLLLAINAYARNNTISSINGDDSDYGPCETDTGISLCDGAAEDDDDDEHEGEGDLEHEEGEEDEFEPVDFVGHPSGTSFSQLSALDPEDVDGTYNTGKSVIKSHGLTLQLTQIFSNDHQLTLGVSADKSKINFNSATQFAILHNDTAQDDRSVTPIGLYDQEAEVGLDVETKHYSAFAQAHIQVSAGVSVELGGRFQKTNIEMVDLYETGEGSLNGTHDFKRFNPAIGLRYESSDSLVTTLSYSESSRNPSPAELSCADENDPCKLPNGFVSDPPLEQVVVKTWELGFSKPVAGIQAEVILFNTKSLDDIIFQQAGAHPSRGYFVNIDETRRQGIEFSMAKQIGALHSELQYSYLDATFESPFVSFSPQNPLGPNRLVNPGSSIPGQPKHNVKLLLDYQLDKLSLATEINYVTDSFYRGDEANENQKVGSYVLTNLVASYQYSEALSFGLRIDNLFDKQYFTFGTYGEADEVLEDSYEDIDDPYFVGPAKPRSAMFTLTYKF